MNCKICNHSSLKIFDKIVLLKYKSYYYRCSNCGFVQTDEAIWLNEAYGNAITSLDIGILNRNDFLKDEISKIINACFPECEIFLDFAGGYGLLVRAMRDKGFNFYRQDKYCENLFAVNFDIENLSEKKFDLVTAFEVFEHLDKPLEEIENILKFSDHLIFSTDIVPANTTDIEDWIYIAHETGQHIAFYTEKSLKIIADKFGKNYYRSENVHVFTNKVFSKEQISYAFNKKRVDRYLFGVIKRKIKKFNIKRESFQKKDYYFIKKILNSK